MKTIDHEFIIALKSNRIYQDIDVDFQLGLMDAWLLAHPKRMKTKKFVVNWLNREAVRINEQKKYIQSEDPSKFNWT